MTKFLKLYLSLVARSNLFTRMYEFTFTIELKLEFYKHFRETAELDVFRKRHRGGGWGKGGGRGRGRGVRRTL